MTQNGSIPTSDSRIQPTFSNLMYDLPTFQRPSASLLIGVQA